MHLPIENADQEISIHLLVLKHDQFSQPRAQLLCAKSESLAGSARRSTSQRGPDRLADLHEHSAPTFCAHACSACAASGCSLGNNPWRLLLCELPDARGQPSIRRPAYQVLLVNSLFECSIPGLQTGLCALKTANGASAGKGHTFWPQTQLYQDL